MKPNPRKTPAKHEKPLMEVLGDFLASVRGLVIFGALFLIAIYLTLGFKVFVAFTILFVLIGVYDYALYALTGTTLSRKLHHVYEKDRLKFTLVYVVLFTVLGLALYIHFIYLK